MLIQNFFPAVGGAERQALELSRSLAARGIAVTVITRRLPGTPSEEDIAGVRVLRLACPGPVRLSTFFFMIGAFFHLLRRRSLYDAVHVHMASSHAVSALLAARFTGKRTFIKLADGKAQNEITLSRKTFPGRLKLAFFRMSDPVFLVLNAEVLDWLRKQPGFEGLRLILFRNGVDTGRYSPPLYQEKLNSKSLLGLGNSQVFLFVGRLDPKKRVRELVELWAEIVSEKKTEVNARLVIVGSGGEEAAVRSAVGALGLSGSVVLAGMREDPRPYYMGADVFMLPSIAEGLSNSMLEAMSCGLAILASRVGGAREAVAEGENGFLFDPFSRQELKERMLRFLAEPSLAVKMGEKSREVAVSRYSMARVTEDLVQIYAGGDPGLRT
ncbi:MAG: group 1 glycosyl transferase [Elusimicrobia bacterium]|nr:MAG: group 1 glycosyl transferase [Elusimicrobiota bacterium]KAF0156736.1 MAG: group 1 glycosyl transferase [Elusimicrobiota bacterium]